MQRYGVLGRIQQHYQQTHPILQVTLLEEPLIYAVDIEDKEVDSASLTKSLFIFGEHSRELISAETGLHLFRQLCGKEPNKNVNISQILQKNKFRLIINSNPKSRKLVEEGSYCQRTNENNVDLNRNWDAHWTKEYTAPETNPGPKPFSEPETRALKEALVEFKPTTFLTVHSGALGMYTPYAYLPEDARRNEQNMLDILDQLNPKYCNCKSGSAAAMLDTTCPGTCLDYAYENQAPYAFAFEIYKKHQELPGWSAEDSSVLTLNQKAKKLRGAGPRTSHSSCFFETSSQQQ